jgi:hypothetical protein
LTRLEQWLAQQIHQKGDAEDSCIVISVSAESIHNMRIYGKNELDKKEQVAKKAP